MARPVIRDWLAEVRRSRGQTQAEMLQEMGRTARWLFDLSTDQQRISKKARASLAGYLDITPDAAWALVKTPSADGHDDRQVMAHRVESALAEAVEILRWRRGQQLDDVCLACGISISTLFSMLSLKRDHAPRQRSWAALAAYLGLTVDEVIEMAHTPAQRRSYPIETLIGTKWHPTLHGHYGDCAACPVCEWCREDVLAGDFAWCEDLADVDFQPD
jgi:transcriptional regulator with XRE-family HTH domain